MKPHLNPRRFSRIQRCVQDKRSYHHTPRKLSCLLRELCTKLVDIPCIALGAPVIGRDPPVCPEMCDDIYADSAVVIFHVAISKLAFHIGHQSIIPTPLDFDNQTYRPVVIGLRALSRTCIHVYICTLSGHLSASATTNLNLTIDNDSSVG